MMTTENCVDAAMRGLELGEALTVPSIEDPQEVADFQAASTALLGAGMYGKPASRYELSALASA